MVIRPRTSNKLLKTPEFHVDYLAHAHAVLGVSRAESVPNLTRRFVAWLAADASVREQLRGLEEELDQSAPPEISGPSVQPRVWGRTEHSRKEPC